MSSFHPLECAAAKQLQVGECLRKKTERLRFKTLQPFQYGDRLWTSESDVHPRTERIKIMTIDQNPLVLMVYTKIL